VKARSLPASEEHMSMRRAFIRTVPAGLLALGAALSASVAPAIAADAEGPASRVTPPAMDDLQTLCALLSGCQGLPIAASALSDDFGACMKRYGATLASPASLGVSLSVRECGMRANSCAGFRDCLLRGVKPESCAGRGKSGPVGMCDPDGRAVVCAKEKVAAVRDCPRGGEHCRVRNGEAVCVLDRCDEAEGDKGKCLGSKKTVCDKGLLVSVDCGVLEMACEEGPEGAACVPHGAACTSDRCAGTTAIGCFAGKEVAVDCAKAGLTCNEGSGVLGRCQRAASDPPACPADGFRCEGAAIKGCFAGSTVAFQCAGVGLKRCEAAGKSVRCAP
jgi:hypothetical protein